MFDWLKYTTDYDSALIRDSSKLRHFSLRATFPGSHSSPHTPLPISIRIFMIDISGTKVTFGETANAKRRKGTFSESKKALLNECSVLKSIVNSKEKGADHGTCITW